MMNSLEPLSPDSAAGAKEGGTESSHLGRTMSSSPAWGTPRRPATWEVIHKHFS